MSSAPTSPGCAETTTLRIRAPDRDKPVTSSGLRNTAYMLLMALIVYVWIVGG